MQHSSCALLLLPTVSHTHTQKRSFMSVCGGTFFFQATASRGFKWETFLITRKPEKASTINKWNLLVGFPTHSLSLPPSNRILLSEKESCLCVRCTQLLSWHLESHHSPCQLLVMMMGTGIISASQLLPGYRLATLFMWYDLLWKIT